MGKLRWVVVLSLVLTEGSAFAADIDGDYAGPAPRVDCETLVGTSPQPDDFGHLVQLALDGQTDTGRYRNARLHVAVSMGILAVDLDDKITRAVIDRRAHAERTHADVRAEVLAKLVELAVEDNDAHAEFFKETYRTYMRLTGHDTTKVDEEIAMGVLMAQAEPSAAIGHERDAVAAHDFAREHGLVFPAALLRAIVEGRPDLVRGFLLMHQHGNEICQTVPGYRRFCKAYDLNAGWQNQTFLVEAAKASEEIALILIQYGVRVPVAQLKAVEKSPSVDATILHLMDAGVTVDAKELGGLISTGRTSLAIEALRRHPELADQDAATNEFPLIVAAQAGDVDVVDYLLNTAHVGVDQKAQNKPSAIFFAVTLDHPGVLEKLLEGGADVNQRFATKSVLIEAVLNYGSPAMATHVKELILAGADVNAPLKGDTNVANLAHIHRGFQFSSGTSPLRIANTLADLVTTSAAQANLHAVQKLLKNNGAK